MITWKVSHDLYKLPLTSLIVGIHKEHSINLPMGMSRMSGMRMVKADTYYKFHTTSVKLNHLDFYSSFSICFYPLPLHGTYAQEEDCVWKGRFETGESGKVKFTVPFFYFEFCSFHQKI